MTIRNVQLKKEGANLLLTANCKIRPVGSDTIYFKFDSKFEDFVVADASPFVAALLVPAMSLGEDLIIDGEISEQLYKGMLEIMRIMASWKVGLKSINIQAKTVKKDAFDARESAVFFSGGVDSFYTYLSNKEKGEGSKYFILANGYDITLGNKQLWNETCQTIDRVAEAEGITVIKVESNLRGLIEPIIAWEYTHGGALAALALALRKNLKQVSIASTNTYEHAVPKGSHPDTDKLWGTETMTIKHDGADTTRLEKVKFISRYPIVLQNLRVCYRNRKGAFNCGKCDKCIRTMISLVIAGKLNETDTFPHTIDLEKVSKLITEGNCGAIFHRENVAELVATGGDPALIEAINTILHNIPSSKSQAMKVAFKAWSLDHAYNRGRLYRIATYLRSKVA